MNGELIMLVGLPGSGKTTWAKKYAETHVDTIVCSSDDLRVELYGDVFDNSHNGDLFNKLNSKIIKAVKTGKTVIYDATNMNKRRRVDILKRLKGFNKKCVLFLKDINECKFNNKIRDERKVPDYVIDRMYKSFNPPHYHEGFDKIEIVQGLNTNLKTLLNETKGFDQENEHHALTLYEHMKKASQQIPEENKLLWIATAIHDIGKLFTKTRLNCKGINDGNCHYYGHHCAGAYEFLVSSELKDATKEDIDDALYIANLISFHMHPYLSWKQSEKAKARDKKLIGDKMFNDIIQLHIADVAAY